MKEPMKLPDHPTPSKAEKPAPMEDRPGKEPMEAAPAGARADTKPGMAPLGQGAQVILTGDAQAAARGGTHDDIHTNTVARDKAIAAGHVAPGTTAEAADDATMGVPPEHGQRHKPKS